MLTVKHIDDDGHETLRSIVSASYHPAGEDGYAVVRALEPNDEWVSYASGRVYVMNDNGKTVANYDLRGKASLPKAA